MAENDLLVGFVLDRSPSMSSLTHSTIEGFNTFVADHLKEKGRTWMSLTLFDQNFDVRYVAQDLKTIPVMSAYEGPNQYRCNGSGTALYDAVGITIEGISAWQKNNTTYDGKILIAILTDGEENMSRQWTLDRMNQAIADAQTRGWEFVFLGSGQSAWLEAKKFATIAPSNVYRFTNDAGSTTQSYAGLSASTSILRSAGGQAFQTSNEAWQDEYNRTQTNTINDATSKLSGKVKH